MSSPNHDDLVHLKIPLENIRSATDKFDDERVVNRNEFEKTYWGKLLWSGESIIIYARRSLNKESGGGDQQFWMEISLLSLKHKNLVSLVGFCDENDEKIIVYMHEIRGTLSLYLSKPMLLTWVCRLEICVGIAQALSYIQCDDSHDFSVTHCNLDSSSILLNGDWEPKLPFQNPVKIVNTKGYGDPRSVNNESDMYSFGILMLEILCCKNKYMASLPITLYREKKLNEIIDLDLWNQMDSRSFKIFAEIAYECLNEERSEYPNIGEIVIRLKKALEFQRGHPNAIIKEFAHLKAPLEIILSATNNFAEENVIGEGGFGKKYRGQLLWSGELIEISARRLKKERTDREELFWMEVSMLSRLKHKNLVSLVGFCDENDEKIVIVKTETMGLLINYLSDSVLLTWVRRLEICVGIAHALSYIHYDEQRDFSVIYRNINSGTIILNDDWEPKLLCDFECSMKVKASTLVDHKSDVYSFGIILFELLCGRESIIANDQDNKYLVPVALFHHRENILNDIVDPNLWKQMDQQSFNIFVKAAHDCLKEERSQRPSIDEIVPKLEKALELQLERENASNEHTIVVGDTSSSREKGKSLEHLKIGLADIMLATENLDEKYWIGSGGYGEVYKGELEHFDTSICSSIEGVNKCDLPKRRSTVAVKRIFNPKGEQGFNVEIETLSSCKHDNIISLLGFCDEGPDHKILIYELASRGSLDDNIKNDDKRSNLTWVQRMKICLNIAHGLKYIHTNTDQEKQKIIHRDIKSGNILLGDNWEAKIADFGLSKIHPADQEASTLNTCTIAGTDVYLDPEYNKHGRLNKKSDIYSFGVVLFEVLTGRLAYDCIYTDVNKKGIAPIARHHFENGKLIEIIDHKIKEEADGHVFALSKGPNKDSIDIFSEIAYRCLVETQAQRPTIEEVIHELQKALQAQEISQKENFKMSLEDMKSATQNLSDDNLIGRGGFGNVYKGVARHANGHTIIAAKRLDRMLFGHGETGFFKELDIPLKYKHENVIGLVGYCDDEIEKVILHDFASRGRLDAYLSDPSLTWVMRLKICIDIASGLNFLHETKVNQEVVIHRDIKSSNILLFDGWKAKITGFALSLVCPVNQDIDFVIDDAAGTIGYSDPLYTKTQHLTKESDIFSLGAVLFDILCGKQSSIKVDDEYLFLPFLAKNRYQVGKLDELVFEGIKEQVDQLSFATFARIAYQCLHHKRERRPKAGEVVIQLKRALEFKEDHELWESKLPTDYKEIIQMSKCPEIYYTMKREELCSNFSRGILLQQDKVWLACHSNGERNEMVSATMFSYIDSSPHKWNSLKESRFETTAEVFDISNLNIEIKTKPQFSSPNVNYGVFLVFKFFDSRSFSSKPMYVNLKYKKGNVSQHAYFATWRDKEWMMIELDQYSNLIEDVVFEFLLESFSSYHCGDGAIYVEGIEFRAIEKVKLADTGKLEDVPQVLNAYFSTDEDQLLAKFKDKFMKYTKYEELYWFGNVNGKKILMLSAKATIPTFSNVKLYSSRRSINCRFREVGVLLPQQVFHIRCTIENQMLSPDTQYVCYLVFKISKDCQGMHNPVKVQDLLHHNESEFCYFITPSPLNINDFTRVPKRREDEWMEIQLWKFNSDHELENDSHSVNMKFTSQEGTMSGLYCMWPRLSASVKEPFSILFFMYIFCE